MSISIAQKIRAASLLLLSGLFWTACQKEPSSDLLPTPEPGADNCRMDTFLQGLGAASNMDSIYSFVYDEAGYPFKIYETDEISQETDSIVISYLPDHKIQKISYLCPDPVTFEFTYSGQNITRIKYLFSQNITYPDSTVIVYEYNTAVNKPSVKKIYDYENGATGNIDPSSVFEFTYNDAGDIVQRKEYDQNGNLAGTITCTYTNQPNSFSMMGMMGELYNLYDPMSWCFKEAWWSTHNLNTVDRVDGQNNVISHTEMHYEINDKSQVIRAQATTRYPDGEQFDFHYSFGYECN